MKNRSGLTIPSPCAPSSPPRQVTGIDGVGGRAASSTRPRSATTRFGTGARQWEKGSGGPGPAYSPSIAPTVPKSPTWSFAHGARDSAGRPSTAPGPGAYDSSTNALGVKPATLASPPASPFPKGERFSALRVSGPGPGAYGTPADVRCVLRERAGRGEGLGTSLMAADQQVLWRLAAADCSPP